MEKTLSKMLLKCKTSPAFTYAILDFIETKAKYGEWYSLDKLFTEKQEAWKQKTIARIKEIIDADILKPDFDISFKSDYSAFKVIRLISKDKFHADILHKQTNNE